MRLNRPYLITRSLCPENMESPIRFLRGPVTPTEYFYRRNHFTYPDLSAQSYQVHIDGLVNRPRTFTFEEIRSLKSREVTTVLECAGNRRNYFRPRVYGERWEDGALSQGVWQGVFLGTLLAAVGMQDNVREIVFTGWDHGESNNVPGQYHFQRSLPLNAALDPDTIIAHSYNGLSIPVKHGHPLRLIVPKWYAMASVKWLKQITAIGDSFGGPFQTVDYNYYPDPVTDVGKYPVTTMHVNSVIQYPLDYSVLRLGIHQVEGIAWTGKGMITKVEVSLDNGMTWSEAFLKQSTSRYSWREWLFPWEVSEVGTYTIIVRARDSSGRIQPFVPMWNRMGYGYNGMSKVHVKILI
ncbi:sulfite oxidase [Alicyclobacillus dauci]|uniref:Sulfite oxidase n=1 Tax=Alicyclobacillus dauci TaxID=1475485 RepID=A0ABY6YYS3_9BACL|nr:sulfite oxidase [Alicyclobacillus dauci]WAH35271.1 sulfite oxidase [Alicyclobacillus dauci]